LYFILSASNLEPGLFAKIRIDVHFSGKTRDENEKEKPWVFPETPWKKL